MFRNTVCERLDTNIVFANDFDRDAWACYNNNELLTNDGVHSRLGDIREIRCMIFLWVISNFFKSR